MHKSNEYAVFENNKFRKDIDRLEKCYPREIGAIKGKLATQLRINPYDCGERVEYSTSTKYGIYRVCDSTDFLEFEITSMPIFSIVYRITDDNVELLRIIQNHEQ